MGTHKPVDPDPKQIKDAQNLWDGFTKMAKYSTIFTIVILGLLAITLVSWS